MSRIITALCGLVASASVFAQTPNLIDRVEGAAASLREQLATRQIKPTDPPFAQGEAFIDANLGSAARRAVRSRDGATRILATAFEVYLRRLNGNGRFLTEIPSMRDFLSCGSDLVLGGHPSRYARALLAGDEAELLLVSLEWQNGLNCLSARQVDRLARMFGIAAYQAEAAFPDSGPARRALADARMALLNLALLTFDASKGLGAPVVYDWLRVHESALAGRLPSRLDAVYLFDLAPGELVAIDSLADFGGHLTDLLDPANLGFGRCGLLEMYGAGRESGNFACGRGVSCGPSGQIPSLARGSLGPDGLNPNLPSPIPDGVAGSAPFGGASPQDRFGRMNRGLEQRSPYGPLTASLNACSSSGGGPKDRSIDSFSSLGGFAACSAAVMMSLYLDNHYGYCVLRAMVENQPDPLIVVPGPGGRIRGILANQECLTDPLAEGGGGRRINSFYDLLVATNPGGYIDVIKQAAIDRLNTPAGEALIAETYEGLLAEYQAHAVDAGVAANQTVADRAVSNAERHMESDLAKIKNDMIDAIENAEYDESIDSSGATLTKPDGTPDGNIKFNFSDGASFGNMIETLLHEAMHRAVNNRGRVRRAPFWRFSENDSVVHKPYWEALEQNFGWIFDEMFAAYKERLAEESEEEEPEGTDTGTDDDTLPVGPHGPDGSLELCGAAKETVDALLACQQFSPLERRLQGTMFGDGLSTAISEMLDERPDPPVPTPLPEGGDGTIDPSFEQWIQSTTNPFEECFSTLGMGVAGVDSRGRYIVLGESNPANRACATIQCGPDERPVVVGGMCRCSAGEASLPEDFLMRRLCQTSDICFDRIDEDWLEGRETVDRQPPAPVEPD